MHTHVQNEYFHSQISLSLSWTHTEEPGDAAGVKYGIPRAGSEVRGDARGCKTTPTILRRSQRLEGFTINDLINITDDVIVM